MNERDLHLIRDYLDDRISPEGLEQLNQLLESDADLRTEFRAMATLEEGLRDLSVVRDLSFSDHDSLAMERMPKEHPGRWYRVEHIGIAALFIVCVGLAVLLWRSVGLENDWGDAIARIEFLSEDIEFDSDHQLAKTEGSLLGKGWVQLERGRMRIVFRSGAVVETEGPAGLGIDTPMRAFLDYGKVMVYAPTSGRDFVVATDSMEIVDLGTRFEVSVDAQSRESKVSVIEGLVDLHLGSRGADRMIRPLQAGYAARVDAFGKIVEMTNGSVSLRNAQANDARIVAHWTFDEPDTEGMIHDSTAHQLHGNLQAEGHTNRVPGVSGQAIAFKDNASVDLGQYLSTLTQLNAFTFAAWVRDPVPPIAMLFSVSGNSEQHRVQFYLSRGFVRFGWQAGLHFDSISGRIDRWETGQWYHVAVTAKDGVIRLYRNGELIASGSMGSKIGTPIKNPSMVKNPSHAYLGLLHDGEQGEGTSQQWFKGQMDDVQLYSGALSQEAIRFVFEHPGERYRPESNARD